MMVAIIALICGGCGGCAQLQKGADPIVVRAEQLYQGAHSIMDSFLSYEMSNREVLKQLSPQILETANLMRRDGPKAVDGLMAATEAYKANRTPENRANLSTYIALVDALQNEALRWIATMKVNRIIE